MTPIPSSPVQAQRGTDERERLVAYARKAVQCLYIAVEECVARDCSAAVNAALDADAEQLRARDEEIAALKDRLRQCREQLDGFEQAHGFSGCPGNHNW